MITKSIGKVLIPYRVRQRLVEKFKSLNIKYVPRSPMKPELRKKLQAEFVPEVEQLSELLGRDLTHWYKT